MKGLLFLFLLTLGCAYGQERYNYLSVNSTLLDDTAGPYYFIKQGNNKDSYARADLLAEALGFSFNFDNDALHLEKEGQVIELKTTTDVVAGLIKRSDVLIANNQAIESPMGIIVDNKPYAPITPIAKALGGESGWKGDANLVWVHFDPKPLPAPQAEPEAEVEVEAVAATPSSIAVNAPQGNVIAAPRIGFQEAGQTRVVLDLPPGSFYELFAFENTLIVKLPNLTAGAFNQTRTDDPNLENLRYALIDNTLALVIKTRHSLDPQGSGYKFSLLASTAEIPHERLLVEVSPSFTGEQAIQSAQGLNIENLTPAAIISQAPPSHQKVVVIDAGHGGKDSGAASYATEKDVVLAVTLKLRALLEAQGIKVILTRDGDYFLELEERADFATPDINLFVAIHANSAVATEAHGVETWVFGEPLEPALLALALEENGGDTAEGQARTAEARKAADDVMGTIYRENQLAYSTSLAELVQNELVNETGARDRGVKQNVFYVIKNARSPAILVEVGFVSNPDEGSKLASDTYQSTLAQAIANGVVQFFNNGGTIAAKNP
jgi:N-acetylmuramoyl-L-alanine amidase